MSGEEFWISPFFTPDQLPIALLLRESYNFYHSQLRIRIECAFGMLTHRWSILRSAIPRRVSIRKTVALVLALAKLHNFCIDSDDSCALSHTARDEWNMELNGAIPLVITRRHSHNSSEAQEDVVVVPQQLLDAGNHFDDIGGATIRYNRQRRYSYWMRNEGMVLPRDRLHTLIASVGLTRPTPLPSR